MVFANKPERSWLGRVHKDGEKEERKETNLTMAYGTGLFSLAGRTVVVTGGSGGVGTTVSRHLLQAGASLALVDSNLPRLEPAAADLSKWYSEYAKKPSNDTAAEPGAKQTISSWACDIADSDQVAATMRAIREHHGRPLQGLVNSAGYTENIPALEYPALNAKRITDVNLNGSFFVAREFARLAIQDKVPASIALIASMSGLIINHPQPQTPYNFTKAGVIHMARSLASEFAPHHIRVNSLSPGYIATALTREILARDEALKQLWESKVPLGRMADPDEFGGPLVYMLSDASSYMTGHDLVVDGGYTVW